MEQYSAAELATAMRGVLKGEAGTLFRFIATDSRRIHFPSETVFFCLTTSRRDAHAFLPDAFAQGIRLFVVNALPDAEWAPQATWIVVPDTLEALQRLAAFHRSRFNMPVLAITGSNGKTIVKEWLFDLLEPDMPIVRSPKSYNSQIGVPLSVMMMHQDARLAIFEAGISQPGEMEKLEAVIQPTLGLFTMLGDAHNEGFTGRRQKIAEKFKLFIRCSHLICHTDDPMVMEAAAGFGGTLLNWGSHANAWMQITELQETNRQTRVQLTCNGQHLEFFLPFTDAPGVENALHCIAFLLFQKTDPAVIGERLARLRHLDMRMQWKKAIHQCYLLNDSYSNDFTSLVQALHYLRRQSAYPRKTVILSDLSAGEGRQPEDWYLQLAGILKEMHIQRLIGVGPAMLQWQHLFSGSGLELQFFDTTEKLLEAFPSISFFQEDILLKGGRHFEFEKVAALLEALHHQTVLEIDLSALAANLRHYRSLIAPQTKIMAMVKAFGYGSGDAEIARVLQFSGVDYLAVAYTDEGVALRTAGVHLPVLVLNPEPESYDAMEAHNLEPELFSFESLESYLSWCRQKGLSHMPVHLKLDTGMHRLGFPESQWEQLGSRLAVLQELTVKSVFTHLVASEDAAQDAFTRHQIQLFSGGCSLLEKTLGYSFIRHAANTAAIVRHREAHFDMVRLGIGLFGTAAPLTPVVQLMTTVAQVKEVKAGLTVGYGRETVLQRDSRIATVRIGYADGYRRALSRGVGRMWVRGRLAPVAGNVCMDMTMLDVTDIPGVQAGDRVEVFGHHIGIGEVARQCGTISYEIMSGISQRVRRVYIEG